MKTCLKNLLSHTHTPVAGLSVVAALASLILASNSQAQVVTKSKAPIGKTTTQKSINDKGISSSDKKLPTSSVVQADFNLSITELTALRDGGPFVNNKISVKGLITNSGKKASPKTPYTLSRLEAGTWKVVQRGQVDQIAPNGTFPVFYNDTMRYTALQYKLEVQTPQAKVSTADTLQKPGTAKPTLMKLSNKLAAMQFVVKYQAVKDVLYMHFQNAVEPVNKDYLEQLTKLGFKSRVETIRHPYLDKDRIEINIYIVAGAEQTRTFNTQKQAENFRDTLPQLDGIKIVIQPQ